jgi:hypothetical protein
MRTRSFGIGPADDHELLPIERFDFPPQAMVPRRVRSVNRLGNDAFEAELARVPQNKFVVARHVTIELKVSLVREQWLKPIRRSCSA